MANSENMTTQGVTVLSRPESPEFSVCTMVTRRSEYDGMRRSFMERGFVSEKTEYLIVDNSVSNQLDAYQAVNAFLQTATAEHIIICHQDVLLLGDGKEHLRRAIVDVEARDSTWAVLGNAGVDQFGRLALCLSDPYGNRRSGGPFPARVRSVDENFMVIKRKANLAVSRDLCGFHHYGSDLCIIADVLGWSAYVIDFYLCHNSGGTVDQSYIGSRRRIALKYKRAFKSRWIHVTTKQPFFVTGSNAQHFLRNTICDFVRRINLRVVQLFFK